MNATRLQQAVFIFIGGTLLCAIASGSWLLNGEMNIINALASFNTINLQTSGIWAVPKGLITFFSALITMFSWDYPFLGSSWCLFIKIPLWIVSIGMVWALVEGAKSVIDGIVGSVRSLIGG